MILSDTFIPNLSKADFVTGGTVFRNSRVVLFDRIWVQNFSWF